MSCYPFHDINSVQKLISNYVIAYNHTCTARLDFLFLMMMMMMMMMMMIIIIIIIMVGDRRRDVCNDDVPTNLSQVVH